MIDMSDAELTVIIIDDKSPDDKPLAELLATYSKYSIKLAPKMRHFSFEYAKKKADENHV